MSRDVATSDQSLIPILGPLQAKELAKWFCQRADLTYRRIENVTVSDIDMYMSALTGTLIRDSTFRNVSFSRSDLDGMRAETSVFISCDFTHCDIRSSVFAKCRFDACTFSAAFIDDCKVQRCTFVRPVIEGASLTHCNFYNSELRSCRTISRATFLHNKLYDCLIDDINVGDCTLLYTILRTCVLKNLTISAECIGGVFGITREQLSSATITYLGESQSVPSGIDLINLVYEEYQQRRWYLGQLVLSLNFGFDSTLDAFDAYLAQTHRRFAEFQFAKGDELEFIGDLLEELAFRERLPLLTAISVLEWCGSLESEINQAAEPASQRSTAPLGGFANRVALLTNVLVDKLDRAVTNVPTGEEYTPICIEVAFERKPLMSAPDLLNRIAQSARLFHSTGESSLIRTRQGSYIEIVLTTLFSVMSFQVFVFLINGCLIQLTELKERVKVLMNRTAPQSYVEKALKPTQGHSPVLLSLLPAIMAFAKGLPWIKEPTLGGYVASNLQSIREVDCGTDAQTKTTTRKSRKKPI